MRPCATLIIPAYNEGARIRESFPRLRARFEGVEGIDVVVVDDGSTDDTVAAGTRALAGWPLVQFVRLPWNQGKGSALKAGVAFARGEYVVLMDADLSGDLDDLERLTAGLQHSDVVVGTRMAAGSRTSYVSGRRRQLSRVFNLLACTMTGVQASDTQCGYKALRTPVAKLLFHLTETRGFAVDVELLVLAQLLGFSVTEMAIGWQEVEGSQVRLVRDSYRMLRDVDRARRFAAQARKRYGNDSLVCTALASAGQELTRSRPAPDLTVVDLRAVEVG